jgi:hypothetical protein
MILFKTTAVKTSNPTALFQLLPAVSMKRCLFGGTAIALISFLVIIMESLTDNKCSVHHSLASLNGSKCCFLEHTSVPVFLALIFVGRFKY